MSETGDIYTFLPWLRRGIAGRITAGDNDTGVKTRASVRVDIELAGLKADGTPITDTVGRDVAFFGPGDIIGIDQRMVIRTEPRHWITNFEPNFLAHIEFYDEDFPWRYTPAAPSADGLKLRPWLTLAVLEESEFEDGKNLLGRPLPFITLGDLGLLPPAEDLWAWSHVHVNAPLSANADEFVTTDMTSLPPRVAAFLDSNPDRAASRLFSPRRLKENTAYHAFLIPTFETGRLAGLGIDPAKAAFATQSAWATYTDRPDTALMPVYHRWYFRTGTRGDFEYLVELLKPRPVDKRVGTRPIDVQKPGVNLPGITTPPELEGVLKLGGALKVPRERFTAEELVVVDAYDNWDQPGPHPFQTALAGFINLPDDYATETVANANTAAEADGATLDFLDDDGAPDPLITAPLYGRWHAQMNRLLDAPDGTALPTRGNWVHQLNLDPRHRVSAGSGTRVIQKYQQDYMNAAWEQVGDVLDANRQLRWSQFAIQVSTAWHVRNVTTRAAEPGRLVAFAAPAARRILSEGETLRHRQSVSLVPNIIAAPAMRRALRPGGRLARTLPFMPGKPPGSLIAIVNAGEATPAPPKTAPDGITTTADIADAIMPKGVPPLIADWLRGHPDLVSQLPTLLGGLLVLLVLLYAILPLTFVLFLLVLLLVALGFLVRLFARWSRDIAAADSLVDELANPDSVDALPENGTFILVDPDAPPSTTPPPAQPGPDSDEAVLYKEALRDWLTLVQASAAAAKRPEPVKLDLARLGSSIVTALNPARAIPARTYDRLKIPPRIRDRLTENFGEVMYYPIIDTAMYAPLKDLSAELFLPNIGLIAQNSITLLETNQPFIESYMVGLNHEFARELLWREYPTDQRGSTFRQFWEVTGVIPPDKVADENFRESLRDIPKLHRWPRLSKLGDHDARERPGEKEEEAVLVIRGELLKKYPTAVIYAQKAEWTRENGRIVRTAERKLVELAPGEDPAQPPRSKKRFPLYEARVQPDIYFFGFDLTTEEAKGGTGENETDDAGWFFVVQERPGEPRFGFDITREGALQTVNDLAWNDAMPVLPAGPAAFLSAARFASLSLSNPGGSDAEKKDQHDDDVKVVPAQPSSARWAYILYQAPVMVAVHAAEMLKTD